MTNQSAAPNAEVGRNLSPAARALIARASRNPGGELRAASRGDHSAAKVLLKQGLLRRHWSESAAMGRDRAYYSLTDKGRRLAQAADRSA